MGTDLRCIPFLTRHAAFGEMVTSPVMSPTSGKCSESSLYFWLLRACRGATRTRTRRGELTDETKPESPMRHKNRGRGRQREATVERTSCPRGQNVSPHTGQHGQQFQG